MQIKITTDYYKAKREFLRHDKVLVAAFKKTLRDIRKPLLNATANEIMKLRKLKRSDILHKTKGFAFTKDYIKGNDINKLYVELKVDKRSPSLLRFVRGNKEPISQKGIRVKDRKKVRVEIIPGKRQTLPKHFIVKGKNNQYIVATHGKRAKYDKDKRSVKPITGHRSGSGMLDLFLNKGAGARVDQEIRATYEAQLIKNFDAIAAKTIARKFRMKQIA